MYRLGFGGFDIDGGTVHQIHSLYLKTTPDDDDDDDDDLQRR
jgi:hypothetical protein